MEIKLTEAGREYKVGFGGGGGPLKTRTQEELLDLAIMARQSSNKNLLAQFVELPTLADMLKYKTDKELGFIDGLASPAPVNQPNGFAAAIAKKVQEEKDARVIGNGTDEKPAGAATAEAEQVADNQEAKAQQDIKLPDPKQQGAKKANNQN